MAEAIQPLGRTHFGDAANKGNVLTTEEATTLLNDWVENERLRLHMQQVGAVMKAGTAERRRHGRGRAPMVASRPAARCRLGKIPGRSLPRNSRRTGTQKY